MARQFRLPVLGRALSPVGTEFVDVEALGGTLLLAATLAAFAWANFAAGSYADVWGAHLTLGPGRLAVSEDVRHWVNDGLMTLFFFVVGMEIKREVVIGDLRDRRTASLPVIAAFGGMIVPALLYAALNAGGAGSRGWAIPMATDIAFALVILVVLGSRVPYPLRLFLLALAIVDDIGAIFVVATFYSEYLAFAWLLGAFGVIAVLLVARRLGFAHPAVYVVPALALWFCVERSGVHPTIAGVALGLLTPARPVGGRDVIGGLESRLHPWSSLLVVPVFALANAGVHLDAGALNGAATSHITWGIVIGLVVGKPLGIVLATFLGVRVRLGRLPDGLSLRHTLGAGCVAGIGFTVSLFVADLSFTGAMLRDAKVGIVVASIVSAIVGSLWLYRLHVRDDPTSSATGS